MRKLFAISLILALMLQSFGMLTAFLNYEINKDYISRYLCVNRGKPQLHCHGCCYLHKQLKAQEKKERQNPSQSKEEVTIVLYHNQQLQESIKPAEIILPSPVSFYQDPDSEAHPNSIYRPPIG